MPQTLGNIRANRMILTQTILIPGALLYCFLNTPSSNHLNSIVQIAKIYPNCIVFRIGMLYSMYLLFFQTLFIHWWLHSAKQELGIQKKLLPSFPIGLVGIVSFGIFASCIDTKRINYELVKYSCLVADIAFTALIYTINKNIKTVLQTHPNFISGASWNYKKRLGKVIYALFGAGMMIYLRVIDIKHKELVEYLTVLAVVLYFATYMVDFKKKFLGVEVEEQAKELPQPVVMPLNPWSESGPTFPLNQ